MSFERTEAIESDFRLTESLSETCASQDWCRRRRVGNVRCRGGQRKEQRRSSYAEVQGVGRIEDLGVGEWLKKDV